jgi:hypothetical protein
MFATLSRQEGSALVTAMLVMTLCLMVGFTTMAAVDVQQSQSRGERERESSFALSEGALNAQIFMLSTQWPRTAAAAYPTCSQSTAAQLRCPDPSTLVKAFAGVDYNAGLKWTTEVHDNASTVTGDRDQFYDDAVVRSQPGYDENDDGLMWLRAQADIRGRKRTLVALIRAERLDLPFPRNVITANRLSVSNEGRKTVVLTNGSYLVLRCGTATGGQLPESTCQDWDDNKGQVGPNATVKVLPNQRPGLSPETIERMRATAKENNTYFATGCPSLTGEVVFIESANCSYDGGEFNSPAQPGVLIIGSGTISFGPGNPTYHGVLYHVNGSDGVGPASSGTVVTLHGNGCVNGAVVVDGAGGVQIGSSAGASKCDGNISFDANAANNLRAYGTAGIVQNSFREIVAN